jgi:hypothetical protein
MTTGPADLWYVAYGSNTSGERLLAYLEPGTPQPAHRWLWMPHALYFAGHSARWDGGVAFVELTPSGDPRTTRARAHALTRGQFERVLQGENGMRDIGWTGWVTDVPVGGWTRLPVSPGGSATAGKYNAVLRLPDLEGLPAATVTTCRDLPRRPPGDAYLRACRRGLTEPGAGIDVDDYLTAILAGSRPGAVTAAPAGPPGTS